MNKTFKELFEYILEGKYNEVAFPCFPNKDGTGVYPKGINCLDIEGENVIIAISKSNSYLITKKNRIYKNIEYGNLFHVYDEEENEVLTIEIGL